MSRSSGLAPSRGESGAVERFAIADLALCPHSVDTIARWHHKECLRQGLNSRYERRRERLSQHLLVEQSVPRTWVVVDRQAGAAVGCVSLISYHVGGAGQALAPDTPLWLSNLYLESEFRGLGLASSLIDTVVDHTLGLGLDSLWLTATEKTDYYQRRGWQRVRRVRLGGQWVNVMCRQLGPGSRQ